MNVQWFKGDMLPPESGEYYIAIEAQQDIGEGWFAKGDVEITTDYFDKDSGYFDSIGGPNDYWKVLCWADILKPDIPQSLRDKVTMYLGEKVTRVAERTCWDCINRRNCDLCELGDMNDTCMEFESREDGDGEDDEQP